MNLPKSFRRVKSLKLSSYTEDGESVQQSVTLWLDTRGDADFCMILPDYVCAALGVKCEVHSATADKIKGLYEKQMRNYGEWKRNQVATPVILLQVKFLGEDETGCPIERDSFFIESERQDMHRVVAVGLSYQLAFNVNGHLHWRETGRKYHADEGCDTAFERTNSSLPVGSYPEHGFDIVERVGYRAVNYGGTELPYSPELHQKLDSVCDAVNGAARTLHALMPQQAPQWTRLPDAERRALNAAQGEQLAAGLLALGGNLLAAPKEKT